MQVVPGLLAALLPFFCIARLDLQAGGVTVITHGFNSDVNSWITAMANDIPDYDTFPGTNYTIYKVTLTTDGTSYFYQWSRTNGAPPSLTDSGEIIVKLDWSQMSGGGTYDITTSNVAQIATFVLTQTNAISELGGHALAEFPLHLVGHSRGGSLVCEISKDLGTNGVWVDHLTTLDPHPLNNDGFNDSLLGSVKDASARTYVSVLFHDNYWQNMGDGLFVPNGEPVFGAYIRQLSNLSGGYSSSHSDVHLWYHGTIQWTQPVSNSVASDGPGGSSIGAAQRQAWWSAYENFGANAGFYYSLIGGGNRLSTDQPLGGGFPMIRNGYNQWWDLGAGISSNRITIATNLGNWPNVIRFNRLDTNQVTQGESTPVKFYYQWAKPSTNMATVSIYLDDDLNPLNTNQRLLAQIPVPANGAGVSYLATNVTLSASNAAPGVHALFATISGGGRSRLLYAPELVQVVPARTPPTLDIVKLNAAQYAIGVNGVQGETVVLQDSTNLQSWLAVVTNTLQTNRWVYTNNTAAGQAEHFYRALVP